MGFTSIAIMALDGCVETLCALGRAINSVTGV